MGVENLIESALEQAGTVVAIVAHPERGPKATVRYVNQTFAALVRRPRSWVQAASFGDLAAFVSDPVIALQLMDALVAGQSCHIDLPFVSHGEEKWLGLRLTFPRSAEPGVRHAIATGRDITQVRLGAKHEADLQRLLASIFIGINAPVAIVTAAGAITMANPAFHHLVGYSADELKTIRVEDLTAPEFVEAARAAHAKQSADGERYEMPFETVDKGGFRQPVWLTSVPMRDGDQRLQVVTLVPVSAAVPPEASVLPARLRGDAGELRAVSLEAFRAAFGDSWERIASRAMLRADQIIRRRLGREDTVSRVDDHRFIIWFESTDVDRNEATLTAIVRDVRLRFLTEFGAEAAEHVSATFVPAAPSPPQPQPQPQPQDPLTRRMMSAMDFYENAAPPSRRDR